MKRNKYIKCSRIIQIINFLAFYIYLRVMEGMCTSTKKYILLVVASSILFGTSIGTFSTLVSRKKGEQDKKGKQNLDESGV